MVVFGRLRQKLMEDVVKKADEKLYMGKEQGRNRIVY